MRKMASHLKFDDNFTKLSKYKRAPVELGRDTYVANIYVENSAPDLTDQEIQVLNEDIMDNYRGISSYPNYGCNIAVKRNKSWTARVKDIKTTQLNPIDFMKPTTIDLDKGEFNLRIDTTMLIETAIFNLFELDVSGDVISGRLVGTYREVNVNFNIQLNTEDPEEDWQIFYDILVKELDIGKLKYPLELIMEKAEEFERKRAESHPLWIYPRWINLELSRDNPNRYLEKYKMGTDPSENTDNSRDCVREFKHERYRLKRIKIREEFGGPLQWGENWFQILANEGFRLRQLSIGPSQEHNPDSSEVNCFTINLEYQSYVSKKGFREN